MRILSGRTALILVALLGPSRLAGQSSGDRLVVDADVVFIYPPGHSRNCLLNDQFKRGEPVGFRMTVNSPATGTRDPATQLVVHLSYSGKTADLRANRRTKSRLAVRYRDVLRSVHPSHPITY